MYEWTFRPDGKTFDVLELYQSSEAAAAHGKHVRSTFGRYLGQVQKAVRLVIYGSPDEAVKQGAAQLKPVYETPTGRVYPVAGGPSLCSARPAVAAPEKKQPQHLHVDAVVADHRRVLLQSEAAQPGSNVQRRLGR
jgi:hypothetical protein